MRPHRLLRRLSGPPCNGALARDRASHHPVVRTGRGLVLELRRQPVLRRPGTRRARKPSRRPSRSRAGGSCAQRLDGPASASGRLTLGIEAGMTETTPDKPDTAETDVGPKDAYDDVESDPAKGTEEGVDWSDEGG